MYMHPWQSHRGLSHQEHSQHMQSHHGQGHHVQSHHEQSNQGQGHHKCDHHGHDHDGQGLQGQGHHGHDHQGQGHQGQGHYKQCYHGQHHRRQGRNEQDHCSQGHHSQGNHQQSEHLQEKGQEEQSHQQKGYHKQSISGQRQVHLRNNHWVTDHLGHKSDIKTQMWAQRRETWREFMVQLGLCRPRMLPFSARSVNYRRGPYYRHHHRHELPKLNVQRQTLNEPESKAYRFDLAFNRQESHTEKSQRLTSQGPTSVMQQYNENESPESELCTQLFADASDNKMDFQTLDQDTDNHKRSTRVNPNNLLTSHASTSGESPYQFLHMDSETSQSDQTSNPSSDKSCDVLENNVKDADSEPQRTEDDTLSHELKYKLYLAWWHFQMMCYHHRALQQYIRKNRKWQKHTKQRRENSPGSSEQNDSKPAPDPSVKDKKLNN